MNEQYRCTRCRRTGFSPGGLRAHNCGGKRLPRSVTDAMIARQDRTAEKGSPSDAHPRA